MLLIDQIKNAKASQTKQRYGLAIGASCVALLASACDNKDRLEPKQGPKLAESAELFLSPAQSEGLQYLAAYDKQVQASADALVRVKKGMEGLLFDPTSAQYSGIKVGRNGSVCGRYNAKNRYGAYVGFRDFVMTSDGRIVTNDTSDSSNDWATYYSAYVEACGTKSELAAYRSMNASPSGTPTAESPSAQEPDQILDAPPPRKKPASQDIPTA